ncbi:MAG: PEGA domain-containing protein [Deltaproteobacteria bacterium]|nr:PEGA domain-containing protein [Deltaproteobacteria bacterium]
MKLPHLFLRSAFSIALALSSAGLSIAVAADNAEMLIRKGVELRRKGRDRDAADLFRQAYDLSHTPRAAAQLGLCEQALGQWLASEQHLSEALVAESDPWIAGKRDTLEGSREAVRNRLGSLHIAGEPRGAMVTLNDRVLGQLPLTDDAWVLPGASVLIVRKDGYESKTMNVNVDAGTKQAVTIHLTAPVSSPSVAVNSSRKESTSAVQEETVQSGAGPQEATWRPYVMWGALGTGVASLTLGIVSHVQRESHISTFNDENGNCFNDGGTIVGGSACESLHSKISGDTTRMIVGYVGAAVFTGVATVLWATKPSSTEQSVACGVAPNSATLGSLRYLASIQCSGRF